MQAPKDGSLPDNWQEPARLRHPDDRVVDRMGQVTCLGHQLSFSLPERDAAVWWRGAPLHHTISTAW